MLELTERLKRNNIQNTILKNRKGHKLPFILILDVSGSMNYNDNIVKLNEGVQAFYQEILADQVTRDHIDIAVISFGGQGVNIELDFNDPVKQQVPTFKAGGSSPMCTAIIMGLDLLEDQIDLYNKNGILSHPPVMVTLTDGEPTTMEYDEEGVPVFVTQDTPEFKISKKKFNYFVHNMRLSSYSIWFGDDIEDTYFLEQFATSKKNVKKLEETDITQFFKMLGKSASFLSRTVPQAGHTLEMEEDLFDKFKRKG